MLKKVSLLAIALCLFLSFALTACTNKDTVSKDNAEIYFQFTDDLGNKVVLNHKPEKTVSLMGSYSELWLLSGGTLAGVTEDAVSERGLKLDSKVAQIGSVKSPNMEVILSLKPDFVLLSTDIEAHKKLSQTLESADIPHGYFKEDSYSDYLRILKLYTDINQTPELYKKHGDSVEKTITTVLENLPKEGDKPKILLIRSMSTKAKALKEDSMAGIMLKDLNTQNIATKHESLLEDLSMETIIEENPDFIFVTTMGKSDAAIETMKKTIMANPAWDSLKAVKNDKFYILPKELFQYKPNARWGESYEYLQKILYQ